MGLSDQLITIAKGGWNMETTLRFYSSREHPASAVLEELCQASDAEMKRRSYELVEVPVTTVDAVVKEYDLPMPKLLSITTNGAEEEILAGMREMLETEPEYIVLALADDAHSGIMPKLGCEHMVDDDRGHTFRRC